MSLLFLHSYIMEKIHFFAEFHIQHPLQLATPHLSLKNTHAPFARNTAKISNHIQDPQNLSAVSISGLILPGSHTF